MTTIKHTAAASTSWNLATKDGISEQSATASPEHPKPNRFCSRLEGMFHCHRRFLWDSVHRQHSPPEWVKLSRLMNPPCGATQNLFLETSPSTTRFDLD